MLKREKAEVLVCVRLFQSSEPYNAIGMKTLENRFTDTRGFTPWAWTHRAGSENSFFLQTLTIFIFKLHGKPLFYSVGPSGYEGNFLNTVLGNLV